MRSSNRTVLSSTVVALTLAGGLSFAQAHKVVVRAKTTMSITGASGRAVQAINDVVANQERFIVSEAETNSLVVLSPDGRALARVSNTGPGGAMLGHPVQMALNVQGELLVLDAQTPRVARFAARGDSLSLTSVVRLRGLTGVSGLCTLDDRTFVLGTTTPAVASSRSIHVVAADGGLASSFGDGFGAADDVSRILYGAGRLLCLPRERLVVAASRSYPEVRAYDDQGKLRWSRMLPDFRKVSYVESSPGHVEYTYPPDNLFDQTVSTFSPAGGVIVVQVGRRQRGQLGKPLLSLRTMVLSATSGEILGVQTDLPLVRTAGAGRLFSADEAGAVSILSFEMRES